MSDEKNDPQQCVLEHIVGISLGLNVLHGKSAMERMFSRFVTILFSVIVTSEIHFRPEMELVFLISLLRCIEVFWCSPSRPHHQLREQPQQSAAHVEGPELSYEKEPALTFLVQCFGVVCPVQSAVHCDPCDPQVMHP